MDQRQASKASHNDSEWSKQDLVEIYGLDPEGRRYLSRYDKQLYNEVPPDAERCCASEAFRNSPTICVAPRNGAVAKERPPADSAWDRVKEHNRVSMCNSSWPEPGLGYEQVLKAREASPNHDQIVLTGGLSDAELATLVKNAFLCVIPSLYEGFCLPM